MMRIRFATLLLLAVGLSTGCNKGEDHVLADGGAKAASATAAAAPDPQEPTFTGVQDDSQGYGGVPWGAKLADFRLKKLDFCANGCVAGHMMVNDGGEAG